MPDLDGKLYDAYVAYPQPCAIGFSEKVETFALHTLPQVLENVCGYKLFIAGRDCLPGQGTVSPSAPTWFGEFIYTITLLDAQIIILSSSLIIFPPAAIVDSVEENIQASRRLLLLYTASTFTSKKHTSSTSSNNNNNLAETVNSNDNSENKTGDTSFDSSDEVYSDTRQQLECVAAMHRVLLEGSLKVSKHYITLHFSSTNDFP